MDKEIEVTDRYKALNIPYPDPETMCKGMCEGTGAIPVYMKKGDKDGGDNFVVGEDETDECLIKLWEEMEKEKQCDDGWHFVKCPDCGGTGKRK